MWFVRYANVTIASNDCCESIRPVHPWKAELPASAQRRYPSRSKLEHGSPPSRAIQNQADGGLLRVGCGDPAFARARQLRPSKPSIRVQPNANIVNQARPAIAVADPGIAGFGKP